MHAIECIRVPGRRQTAGVTGRRACCRAEQLRERLSLLLCSEFQATLKRRHTTNPVAFLRMRSFNGRSTSAQPPEFGVRRANSDSRLAAEPVRAGSDAGDAHIKSHTVSRFSPVTVPDGDEGASMVLPDPSQPGSVWVAAPGETRSVRPASPFLSRSPSQVHTEFAHESYSIRMPGMATDGGGAVRPSSACSHWSYRKRLM